MAGYVASLLISGLVSLAMTPAVRGLALRFKAYSQPCARSVHTTPVPHMGGVSIYVGFAVAVLTVLRRPSPEMMGVLVAGGFALILGIIDDFRALSPKLKLVGQIGVALVLTFFGVRIDFLTNPYGGMILLGKLAVPLTVFWVVALMNVVNLIDGLDGLAGGTVAIASLTLMFVAAQRFQAVTAILSAAIAGSALGFLPYNFNPAKIFMGDAGAMFLGCALASVSAEGALKSATAIALVPVIALGLPIFDTAFAIVRRVCNGRSVASADRSHIHHRLLEMGLSQKQAVVLLYMASGLLGLTAILSSELDLRTSMPITALVLLGMFAGLKAFGILDLREQRRVK
ncbi:MAG: undecaprenyl/decaprenyl-phosphate alpha-N-acetylglucosaminyl 1-phosphate transferase [Firmicutes bacterium]|nr:undecaprenyl/decaprenyl-phosphate alpha-N-acetylglucosaminyl 1-phosphate transferase [Bacillota bacterium]